jgi:antitoxin HicB
MHFQTDKVTLSYPVNLDLDSNNTYLVTFPDIPEANSVGDDEDDALLNALDALESAVDIYIDQEREIPLPSKAKRGQHAVSLPAALVSKILDANEALERGARKSDVTRLLTAEWHR